MSVDHIRYDLLAQDALRAVVRNVLAEAAKHGLPGEHHFYISFDTRAEGVRLSPRLREQYPEEITIILQHQFWDLIVRENDFEVGLSFGGVPERLTIPFSAIKGFFDPSVQFGLQFETIAVAAEDGAQPKDPAAADAKPGAPRAVAGQVAGHAANQAANQGRPLPSPANKATDAAPAQAAAAAQPDTDRPSGEVVRLDRFRKK